MHRSVWLIALLGVVIVAAASAGIYFANHNRAPVHVAVAPAAPVNAASEPRDPAPEPAPVRILHAESGDESRAGPSPGGRLSYEPRGTAGCKSQRSTRPSKRRFWRSHQRAERDRRDQSPRATAPTTTPSAKAAATIVRNVDPHPVTAPAKKSASSRSAPFRSGRSRPSPRPPNRAAARPEEAAARRGESQTGAGEAGAGARESGKQHGHPADVARAGRCQRPRPDPRTSRSRRRRRSNRRPPPKPRRSRRHGARRRRK